MSTLLFALAYLDRWHMPPIFIRNQKPLTQWEQLTESLPSRDEVVKTYRGIQRREKLGVAVATGPYQAGDDEKRAVIDIDVMDVSDEEKRKIETALAREGFVVVDTPRGMHLHFKVRDDVYAVAVTVGRQHVGEGGALLRHLWTSPPTGRMLDKGFHVYRFVLDDGTATAKYSVNLLDRIELGTFTLNEASMVLEALLGATVTQYRPSVAAAAPARVKGEPLEGWKPLFYDMDEFHARIVNVPLPNPVARILYNYYTGIGADTLAAEVAAKNPVVAADPSPVPHGTRFLAAAEYVLFVTHLVAMARWEEVLEPLEYGVEDWPEARARHLTGS